MIDAKRSIKSSTNRHQDPYDPSIPTTDLQNQSNSLPSKSTSNNCPEDDDWFDSVPSEYLSPNKKNSRYSPKISDKSSTKPNNFDQNFDRKSDKNLNIGTCYRKNKINSIYEYDKNTNSSKKHKISNSKTDQYDTRQNLTKSDKISDISRQQSNNINQDEWTNNDSSHSFDNIRNNSIDQDENWFSSQDKSDSKNEKYGNNSLRYKISSRQTNYEKNRFNKYSNKSHLSESSEDKQHHFNSKAINKKKDNKNHYRSIDDERHKNLGKTFSIDSRFKESSNDTSFDSIQSSSKIKNYSAVLNYDKDVISGKHDDQNNYQKNRPQNNNNYADSHNFNNRNQNRHRLRENYNRNHHENRFCDPKIIRPHSKNIGEAHKNLSSEYNKWSNSDLNTTFDNKLSREKSKNSDSIYLKNNHDDFKKIKEHQNQSSLTNLHHQHSNDKALNNDPISKKDGLIIKEYGHHFTFITDNIYPDNYCVLDDLKYIKCKCTINSNQKMCELDCINKKMNIECGSDCCIGISCANKMFKDKQWKNIEPIRMHHKGWSLLLNDEAKSGDFILEFVGKVIMKENYLVTKKNNSVSNQYCFALDSNHIIDMSQKSNFAKFINHSCQPNCKLETWCVDGYLKLGMFALEDLKHNSELSIDYNNSFLCSQPINCFCKMPNCTGIIGDFTKTFLKSFFTSDSLSLSEKMISGSFSDSDEMLVFVRHCFLKKDVEKSLISQFFASILLKSDNKSFIDKFLEYHGIVLLKRFLNLNDVSTYNSSNIDPKSFSSDDELHNRIFEFLMTLNYPQVVFMKENGILDDFKNFSFLNSKILHKNLLTVAEISLKRTLININNILNHWSSILAKDNVQHSFSNLDHDSVHNLSQTENPVPPNDIQSQMIFPISQPPFIINSTNVTQNPLNQFKNQKSSKDTNDDNSKKASILSNLSNEQLVSILSNVASSNVQKVNFQESNHQDTISLLKDQSSNILSSVNSENQNDKINFDKLPENWISSVTPFGKKYYFNTLTKQTQWEIPTSHQEISEQKEIPQSQDIRKSSNLIDSFETHSPNAIKFKKEASKFVVSLLGLYLKGKMSYGRITNVDDFKFLARKLTHMILTKEIEKKGPANILFDNKTRDRTSEYISNFMKRQGSVYKCVDK